MTTWLLQPRDTLLVRDARPSAAGAMRSLDFPWPSSLAGLVRTRVGTDVAGHFDPEFAEPAKEISVRGPLLVELNPSGEIEEMLVPAPADCIWYPTEQGGPTENFVRRRLIAVDPQKALPGCKLDLDTKRDGSKRTRYLLGHEENASAVKPVSSCAFWRWRDFEIWLVGSAATSTEVFNKEQFAEFGLGSLIREQRTHVSIDAETQTAADGRLFATESLRFVQSRKGKKPLELGLYFACVNPHRSTRPLSPGMVTFGGERKLSFLSEIQGNFPLIPQPLKESLEAKLAQEHCLARVILLTPALFKEGFAPHWIGDEAVKVVAASVSRAQIVSGWDFVNGCPKPNRRMAPAGSVYWVELPHQFAVQSWLEKVWMRCLTNQMQDQDHRDGFGLCAVGVG